MASWNRDDRHESENESERKVELLGHQLDKGLKLAAGSLGIPLQIELFLQSMYASGHAAMRGVHTTLAIVHELACRVKPPRLLFLTVSALRLQHG